MVRDKFKYVDKDGNKWSMHIDAETGKPLVSSVAKKFGIIPKKATKKGQHQTGITQALFDVVRQSKIR